MTRARLLNAPCAAENGVTAPGPKGTTMNPHESDGAATSRELLGFLTSKMRMSHIYQPLLIRTLVARGGTATVRQIAKEFLAHDESQIDYYEHVAKVMPIPVLRRHGIVERRGDEVSLPPNISREEAANIVALCDEKIEAYKAARGTAIWQHRAIGLGAIPGSVRYEVLKRSGGKCALCGIDASERALEVDHIKPRKHGGTDDIENLQALCWKCNSGKSANDSTDFRKGSD